MKGEVRCREATPQPHPILFPMSGWQVGLGRELRLRCLSECPVWGPFKQRCCFEPRANQVTWPEKTTLVDLGARRSTEKGQQGSEEIN